MTLGERDLVLLVLAAGPITSEQNAQINTYLIVRGSGQRGSTEWGGHSPAGSVGPAGGGPQPDPKQSPELTLMVRVGSAQGGCSAR